MTADDLGPRVRAARRSKRWSQQRLADEVGVAVRTIGAWERGEKTPRYAEAEIRALENALGVSLSGEPPEEDDTDLIEQQLQELRASIARIRRYPSRRSA